ncbi:MAG: PilZ protein [Paucimonas sp.]|jgi:hypothetical protein|nr:PilZ protein [Paucimonas sp.]
MTAPGSRRQNINERDIVDKRQSQRKDLRVKAVLTMEGGMRMTVKTTDVGRFGMGLTGLLRQLDVGHEVRVAFEMAVGSKLHQIDVSARVSHCMSTPTEGYRAGVQFTDLNSDCAAVLSQYVGN